jgi:hypothetical protein
MVRYRVHSSPPFQESAVTLKRQHHSLLINVSQFIDVTGLAGSNTVGVCIEEGPLFAIILPFFIC